MITAWFARFGGYLGALALCFAAGWLTCKYQWHNERVKLAAVKEVQIATNKQILHAAENQIVYAETKRDFVRTEYRDRLRDISSGEAKQCPAATPDRATSERNAGEDGSAKEASARTTKDDLADIAAECYAGVSTIREQLRALIQAEESIKSE